MYTRLKEYIFTGYFGYKCYLFLVRLFLQVPVNSWFLLYTDHSPCCPPH